MDNNKKPARKIWMVLPLIMGIASFGTFVLYFYVKDTHSEYIDVILLGPILSLIGVIISIITRKSRKLHPTLWTGGLIICIFSLVACALIIILLMVIIAAMYSGNWL